MNPQNLTELDRRFLWHPFTQYDEWLSYEPIVVDRAEGFELIDTQGMRYIDGTSSLWCNVHGHGHPYITAAVKSQLDKVAHSTLLGLSHRSAIELAERLIAITPEQLTRVFYSDSGATAVEVALRMAFQYWKQIGRPDKSHFITLQEAYHGDTIGSVSLGFSNTFHTGYEPITFQVSKFPPPFLCDPISGISRCTNDALEMATQKSLMSLQKILEREGKQTAAVFIEPLVQGAAGIWPQPASFLRQVRKLCDSHDVLMVCDEVATGFGRTGTLFAVEQAKISPDIMCVGKGITGGVLPLAATLSTEEIFSAFRGTYSSHRALFHGHTYSGNPLGCAAALANLDLFETEDTLNVARQGAVNLANALRKYVENLSHAGPIRQVGSMVGFDILLDPKLGTRFDPDIRIAHQATLAARDQGVIIRPLGDTIVLMPPLTMHPEFIDILVKATGQAVARVTSQ